jgi:ABC-2 type transport system ATP-binding protein
VNGVASEAVSSHIRASKLTVRAGNRIAVNEISLDLGVGVHGVLGPNGAGKTTLLRALATVVRPSGGGLDLLDRTPDRRVRERLGYLPQDFGFYPRFSVHEFVEYMAWLKKMARTDVPDAVRRAIGLVGLYEETDRRMRTLSGGMVRRAGIAQAIVNAPDVLLLDEPTVGLDPAQRLQFRQLVRTLGESACVVISTHLVEDVAAACADVVLMNRGKLVFRGTPQELAAAGDSDAAGDSAVERGYSTVLARRGGGW